MEPKMFIYQSGYATDFHLSGQHDQQTHGRGGSEGDSGGHVKLREVDKKGQAIARKYHGNTTDKQGRDYVRGHLTQVGTSLPPDLALAGWLHDTLEDTHATPESLAADGVDEETIRIVKAVTTDGPSAGGRDKLDYPDKMRSVIAEGGPKAARVKLSDMHSNSDPTRNPHLPVNEKYINKLTLAKQQMKEYLSEAEPSLYQDYIDRIESKPGSFDWSKVEIGEVKWAGET